MKRLKATTNRFTKKGTPDARANNGRPKGSVNKVPRMLVDTILEAGAALGSNGKGKDGLKGYLMSLGARDPRSFAMLLGKILPTQVKLNDGMPSRRDFTATTLEAARDTYADMIALMRKDPSLKLIAGPNVIEGEAEEVYDQ